MYQKTVRSILNQSDHPGISAEELELFKSQFRSAAYTCRLKSCPRATMGFDTDKARLDHELAHVRKFRCTFPDCHFPPFVSAQALKGHSNRYHNPNPAPISIRNIQTPIPPKRHLTRHELKDDQSLRKRRKDGLKSPLSSYSFYHPQLEEDEQALNKRADLVFPRHLFYTINNHQPIQRLGIHNESSQAKVFSDEATEQTKTTPLATRHDTFVSPPLRRGFSPKHWLDSHETVMSEAMQAQNSLPVGSVHLSSADAVPNTPVNSQMQPQIDEWYYTPFEPRESKFTGARRALTDEMPLHHEIQGSQQETAHVGSWHAEMHNFKQPARVAEVYTPSRRNTSSDMIQTPSISDVLPGTNDPEKEQTISSCSADQPSEQYRPIQHREAVSTNRRFVEVSDDGSDTTSEADSDETAYEDWGRELNMDVYHILINLMELPDCFPREELGVPPTFERWGDFWPWMRPHPEFSARYRYLADIQYSQFKQDLKSEAVYPFYDEMKPDFGAVKLEMERVRDNPRWNGRSDDEISTAIIYTKRAIWAEMEDRTNDSSLCLVGIARP